MKYQIKTKLVLILVILGSIAFTLFLVSANSQPDIKIGQMTISEPTKHGSFLISANISENNIISPVLRADFPFTSLYIKWQLGEKENIQPNFDLYVRFLNENWSEWIQMEIDDDYQGKDGSQAEISSQMIPTKLTDSFQYKLILNSDAADLDLKNLQFFYLDTIKGPKNDFHISLQENSNNLRIISRAEWGADESWRYDNSGASLWPEEYYTPKKFVLHHTAGEKANLDPKATIRAIYYWHTKERGWGDIGYNYLIDSSGNIYEGRYGGDAIVAGHAYMRNRNTIGIAILGCYDGNVNEKNQINCNTPDQLTEATKIALNKLIAKKSQEFNIDPNGQSEFHGQMLPNIIGHKDVGNTTCPGNLIYSLMPQTRQLAYNILMEMGGYKKPLPTAAEFVRLSAREINIEETKTSQVVVEYKNTGQETWRGYEDNYLYVTDAEISNKIAKINNFKIALSSDKDEEPLTQATLFPVYKLQGGNIYPGQIGKFNLVLNAPSNETETKNFILAWQNKGYFTDTNFSLTLHKIACNCNQTASGPAYLATLLQSTVPAQFTAGTLQSVNMQFKNDGSQSWRKNKLKLKITYDNNLISPFRNDSWYDEYASIPSNEEIVYPGSIANFEFKLKAPAVLVIFPHIITLYYDEQKLYKTTSIFNVISDYAAQITVNTLPKSAKINSRPKVTLVFKNTGSQTWTNITLKSYDIDYTNSWFKDWSWWDNKTIKSIKKTVAPGEEIEFSFRLLAYWKTSNYPHLYKLFDGKNEIYLNSNKEYLTYTNVTR